MRNLKTVSTIALIWLGISPGAWAGAGPLVNAKVLVPPTPLVFTEVPGSDGHHLAAKMVTTVISNHTYQLAVSFSGLSQGKDKAPIPAQQMAVKINGRPVPVGTTRVEIATGPRTGAAGMKVPITIDIELKDIAACSAGQYSGGLTLYIK